MRYVKPYFREVEDDSERFGEFLLPFLGGAVLGGFFAPAKQVPVYVPSYPYYSNSIQVRPTYPTPYPYAQPYSPMYSYPQNGPYVFPTQSYYQK